MAVSILSCLHNLPIYTGVHCTLPRAGRPAGALGPRGRPAFRAGQGPLGPMGHPWKPSWVFLRGSLWWPLLYLRGPATCEGLRATVQKPNCHIQNHTRNCRMLGPSGRLLRLHHNNETLLTPRKEFSTLCRAWGVLGASREPLGGP